MKGLLHLFISIIYVIAHVIRTMVHAIYISYLSYVYDFILVSTFQILVMVK